MTIDLYKALFKNIIQKKSYLNFYQKEIFKFSIDMCNTIQEMLLIVSII